MPPHDKKHGRVFQRGGWESNPPNNLYPLAPTPAADNRRARIEPPFSGAGWTRTNRQGPRPITPATIHPEKPRSHIPASHPRGSHPATSRILTCGRQCVSPPRFQTPAHGQALPVSVAQSPLRYYREHRQAYGPGWPGTQKPLGQLGMGSCRISPAAVVRGARGSQPQLPPGWGETHFEFRATQILATLPRNSSIIQKATARIVQKIRNRILMAAIFSPQKEPRGFLPRGEVFP